MSERAGPAPYHLEIENRGGRELLGHVAGRERMSLVHALRPRERERRLVGQACREIEARGFGFGLPALPVAVVSVLLLRFAPGGFVEDAVLSVQ